MPSPGIGHARRTHARSTAAPVAGRYRWGEAGRNAHRRRRTPRYLPTHPGAHRLARQLGLQQQETRRRLGFDMRVAADEHRQLTAAAAIEFLRIETRLDRCKAAGYPFVMESTVTHSASWCHRASLSAKTSRSLPSMSHLIKSARSQPLSRRISGTDQACTPLSPETAAKCAPQSPSSWPLTANVAGLLQTAPLSRKIRG